MRSVVWLMCLCTAALAGPSHFGEDFQQLLHSMHEIREELQQETSIDELSALMDDWSEFKTTYERTYENEEEEQQRMKIFAHNRKQIAAHNELYKKGLTTYFMDINKFADMTEAEYIKTLTANNESENDDNDDGDGNIDAIFKGKTLPVYKDWRDVGAITPVRDQGSCSASWAFAATGALESHYFIKYRRLIPLSVQNLIDCSSDPSKDNNQGCEGGLPSNAFEYVYKNNGTDTEAAYPYEAKLGKCRYNCTNRAGVRVADISNLPHDDHSLMQVVAFIGPVAAFVSADLELRFYRGGLFNNAGNNFSSFSHAILVVGYGTDEQTNERYWLVKNSWGTCWGMDGYFKLRKNKRCCSLKKPIIPQLV